MPEELSAEEIQALITNRSKVVYARYNHKAVPISIVFSVAIENGVPTSSVLELFRKLLASPASWDYVPPEETK